MAYLYLHIGARKIQNKFYILNNTHEPIIIGCDILKKLKAKVDFELSQVTLCNKESNSHEYKKTAQLGYIEKN